MTQSSNLRFFGLNKDRKNQTTIAQHTPISTARSPTLGADTTEPAPPGQTNVQGWLMNVPGYREEREQQKEFSSIVEEDNIGIPIVKASRRLGNGRPESISSVSSGDSVNLDDLIKNNFTVQVDDETDLPNLADLDLDDSADDFWKMNDSLTNFRSSTITAEDNKLSNDRSGHELLSIDGPFDENEFIGMGKMNSNDDEELMNWSPESSTEEKLDTLSNASSRTARSRLLPPSSRFSPDHRIKTQRSGSLSSENSLTSQSTITTGGGGNGAYARYGMAPMIYPSESTTSNSSRSHSRLSDYSASSSQASSNATSIPRASSRASSSIPSSNNNTASNHNIKHTSGLRRPSDHHIDRSFRSSSRIGGPIHTNNIPTKTSGSRLAKRATHVPLPSSRAAPKPQIVASSRSTGLSSTRLPSRASHIPSPRASAASPEPRSPILSPRNNNSSSRPRSPFTNSRIGGIRSPTPTGGTPRNSIFSSSESRRQQDKDNSNHIHNSNHNNNHNHNSRIGRPPSSAGNTRQTGLRPPSAIGKVSTGSRRGPV